MRPCARCNIWNGAVARLSRRCKEQICGLAETTAILITLLLLTTRSLAENKDVQRSSNGQRVSFTDIARLHVGHNGAISESNAAAATAKSYAAVTTSKDDAKSIRRMSFGNVTCYFYNQPLDHFAPGSLGKDGTFQQRYCTYAGYAQQAARTDNSQRGNIVNLQRTTAPIFFYVGNESPLEVYVNNTGLMWELAAKHNALIVFAEHRYEGLSKPISRNTTLLRKGENCMAYASSAQALADFAALLSSVNPLSVRPVIVFGGSYGGMLAAWMRMKYPSSVAGAIASSAPIWGLPLSNPDIDGAWVAVTRGLTCSSTYNHGDSKVLLLDDDIAPSRCQENLLAGFVLIQEFGKTDFGRKVLSKVFNLCHPLQSSLEVSQLLIPWIQNPWFLLAEGNFPFRSNYIPLAVGPGNFYLPAWPLRKACQAGLCSNHGIMVKGNTSDVSFSVVSGGSEDEMTFRIDVDWDVMTPKKNYSARDLMASGALPLFTALKEGIGIWYNVSKTITCYDIFQQQGSRRESLLFPMQSKNRSARRASPHLPFSETGEAFSKHLLSQRHHCDSYLCHHGCWDAVCCNENLNLPIHFAKGMGRDFFWPPNYPRGSALQDIIRKESKGLADSCADRTGSLGYPKNYDPWSHWLDTYYGGSRLSMHSNIVFSNGLLDPWSAAGVYEAGRIPPPFKKYTGPMIQNLTEDGSMIALILDQGAHHLDLMFSHEEDPICATKARRIEEEYILRWITEWTGLYEKIDPS